MKRPSSHPPDPEERTHIGRTTRSAFTTPGGSLIGSTTRSPFGAGADGSGEAPPDPHAPLPVHTVDGLGDPPNVSAPDPPSRAEAGAGTSGGPGSERSSPPNSTVHLPIGSRVPDSFRLLKLLLGAWLLLSVFSILGPALTPRSGDGFTRGIDRWYPFFGYQAIAGIVAFVAAYVSRSVVRVSKRWALLGLIPLTVTSLLVLALIAFIALVAFAGSVSN